MRKREEQKKRVEHLNNALRRPANASCDRHIFRADALTLAHPLRARCTLHNIDDDDLPLCALLYPPSHVPSHIPTLYFLSSPPPPLVYPSLTYERRRLSLEIVATKRFTVHIVHRAVAVIVEFLFRSPFEEKERIRRFQYERCEDDFPGGRADVSRGIFAVTR